MDFSVLPCSLGTMEISASHCRFDATKAGLPVLDTPHPSGSARSGADPQPCCSEARHLPCQPTAALPAPSRMHNGAQREQATPEKDTGGVEMHLPEYCDTREEPEQRVSSGVLLEGGGIGLLPGSFDHVLLDAPCSGLGLRPRLQQVPLTTPQPHASL